MAYETEQPASLSFGGGSWTGAVTDIDDFPLYDDNTLVKFNGSWQPNGCPGSLDNYAEVSFNPPSIGGTYNRVVVRFTARWGGLLGKDGATPIRAYDSSGINQNPEPNPKIQGVLFIGGADVQTKSKSLAGIGGFALWYELEFDVTGSWSQAQVDNTVARVFLVTDPPYCYSNDILHITRAYALFYNTGNVGLFNNLSAQGRLRFEVPEGENTAEVEF